MKVLISIPAYNEEHTIVSVIQGIKNAFEKTKYSYALQVVDDGSKDHTRKKAETAGAKVYSHGNNLGLAETFRTELKYFLDSNADVFVHIDADNQYNPQDIPRLLAEIEKDYDLVLGNRFLGGIQSMPLTKRIGNKAFSRAISKIIKYQVGDCQTGFRAFTRRVAKLPLTSTHTYTQEQIIRTVRAGYKIKEIPTFFAARKDQSRLLRGPFEYAVKAWINVLRIYRDYEPLKFFGKIGLFFFSLGFLIGLWLLWKFITTGRVGHLPSTILSMLLILTGIQIILFGFFADMHRK